MKIKSLRIHHPKSQKAAMKSKRKKRRIQGRAKQSQEKFGKSSRNIKY